MLIQTKAGRALLVPGDISAGEAAEMLATLDAVQVNALKLNRDVRFAGPDANGSFDAGEIVCVPEDIDERRAKAILNPLDANAKYHAHPTAFMVERPANLKTKEERMRP